MLLAVLAACGSGGSDSGTNTPAAPASPAADPAPPPAAASRFLTQATFGPTSAEITRLSTMTYAGWIDEQFAKPQSLHRDTMNQAAADLAATGGTISQIGRAHV